MPDRIIRESICTSDTLDKLSWFEEVFWNRLIVNCDDYGRFDARIPILKNRLFPLKSNVTEKAVETALNTLSNVELVTLYEFEGKPYLQLVTWGKHQRIRAKRSKFPAPDDNGANLLSFDSKYQQMETSDDKCPRNPIQSESNAYSNAGDRDASASARPQQKKFAPPSVEEVRAYCQERKNHVNAERFVAYYTSNGWLVGKTHMKDWKAAVRTWEQRDKDSAPKSNGAAPSYDLEEFEKSGAFESWCGIK